MVIIPYATASAEHFMQSVRAASSRRRPRERPAQPFDGACDSE